ncbi:type II toxin-antitoxin system mRNA interferase toxin, RelE/StbE family [Massilia sp. CCM 8733]|uniref:Type II toxin-antitoxin system mRNA interferase toxin, RelE/StbE family n=1 Tax=Massilia mucilaginosa TaxID=2609282 RepID=A0ABX0NUR3_9BURK|nr:type II toxin-antitoxin system mRNA interferase toxin, RelE/StbE family [Massilia mucilaginosa]
MYRLEWKKQANNDLHRIVVHIAEDNKRAAEQLAELILGKVEQLSDRPELYRAGRQRGTREMVVHPHYLVVYRIRKETVEILRVKHTAQRWPPKGKT